MDNKTEIETTKPFVVEHLIIKEIDGEILVNQRGQIVKPLVHDIESNSDDQ